MVIVVPEVPAPESSPQAEVAAPAPANAAVVVARVRSECWSASRCRACAASAIDHRDPGSLSSIRRSTGSSSPARFGGGGGWLAISLITATALVFCS